MPLQEAVPSEAHDRERRRHRPQPRAKGFHARSDRPVVLLVDDHPEQVEMYQGFLKESGYEVVGVTSGIEALGKASELLPDVIVMDLSMPAMDGFETTRLLKQREETKEIPILALTAYSQYLPPEWAKNAGCAGYLSKPCLPSELEEEIGRVLAGA